MNIESLGQMMFTLEVSECSARLSPIRPHPSCLLYYQTLNIDPEKIPREDLLGVTAVLVTCSYMDNEFFRAGYYVNVSYGIEELDETPPNPPHFEKLRRVVMVEQPRVTNFPIKWDAEGENGMAALAAAAGVSSPDASESGVSKEALEQERKEMLSTENIQRVAQNFGNTGA